MPHRANFARLALVIHALDGGGAQRVMAELANHWSSLGHRVTLITLASADRDRFQLDPGVRRAGLQQAGESRTAWQAWRNNRRRVRAIRRVLAAEQAEVVVSFVDQMNVLALLAARPLRLPVLISERSDPACHTLSRTWSWLRRRTYPYCTAAVVQTEPIADWLRPLVRGRPVEVIPNGIAAPPEDSDRVNKVADGDANTTIVSMGRLSEEKGFETLIRAWASVADRYPAWQLLIAGDGPQQRGLQELADTLLPGRIVLCGWTDRPQEVYRRAGLFVLASRYEGFPNVLLEAMACGVPVISSDCSGGGPRAIVRPGVDGLLVPPGDTLALAAALDRALSDDAARREWGLRAQEVTERFSREQMLTRWDALLEKVRQGAI